jgi:hypothetical protein
MLELIGVSKRSISLFLLSCLTNLAQRVARVVGRPIGRAIARLGSSNLLDLKMFENSAEPRTSIASVPSFGVKTTSKSCQSRSVDSLNAMSLPFKSTDQPTPGQNSAVDFLQQSFSIKGNICSERSIERENLEYIAMGAMRRRWPWAVVPFSSHQSLSQPKER